MEQLSNDEIELVLVRLCLFSLYSLAEDSMALIPFFAFLQIFNISLSSKFLALLHKLSNIISPTIQAKQFCVDLISE